MGGFVDTYATPDLRSTHTILSSYLQNPALPLTELVAGIKFITTKRTTENPLLIWACLDDPRLLEICRNTSELNIYFLTKLDDITILSDVDEDTSRPAIDRLIARFAFVESVRLKNNPGEEFLWLTVAKKFGSAPAAIRLVERSGKTSDVEHVISAVHHVKEAQGNDSMGRMAHLLAAQAHVESAFEPGCQTGADLGAVAQAQDLPAHYADVLSSPESCQRALQHEMRQAKYTLSQQTCARAVAG